MPEPRSDHLSTVKTLVIKLGTQLLSDRDRRLDTVFLRSVADQVAALRARGLQVTLVSSGAVGAGLRELNLPARPRDLATLQAVAAVGQRKLMDAWADAFEPHHTPVAQVLLTREDVDHRTRFLNLRNTIHAIHGLNAIPIINENDTVSTDELVRITFGDNDLLASVVAHALRANLLILLSIVDGLLDPAGKPVRLVESVDHAMTLVRTDKSAAGKGGMNSKLLAARTVTDAGECLIVADGRMPYILPRLLAGEPLGTLFTPASRKRPSRSRWIGSVRPAGELAIDAGAVRAILEKGKSLLPAGILTVTGDFQRGDVVAITGPDRTPIARGLSNYAADDLRRIAGRKTADIKALLPVAADDEAVHRNNLVLE